MTQILRRIIADNQAGNGAALRAWLRQMTSAQLTSPRCHQLFQRHSALYAGCCAVSALAAIILTRWRGARAMPAVGNSLMR